MAVNKRKVLDAARKYVQKGAKQRALKEYERLLKADPKDGKLRLEIGDAHRRWGQIDEAVSQYLKVADQYKSDGFDARAVAVYKQVLNLDPKRYVAHVSLSELYQRMGLDAEAIQALQTAADGYHKEGKKREALELLRKMATLDPSNTTSRMKVAELLKQEGMTKEAVVEYEAVAEELERQANRETLVSVYARILEIEPKRADILVGTASVLVQLQQPERAEPFAKKAIKAEPDETDHHELLLDIYKALGRSEELTEATRALAKIFRDRGDQDRAREIMQRVPNSDFEVDASEDAEPAPEFGQLGVDGEEPHLDDEELLDDDFLASDEELASPESQDPEPEPPAAAETPLPEGEPDQLMAEASVYMRYGKRDQARASLEAVLAQEPEHRDALEKLGEVQAESDNPEQAVEHWTRAAGLAAAAGDSPAFEILRDRISALDSEAASRLSAPAADESAVELDMAIGEEPIAPDADSDALDLEIDVGLDEEPSASPGATVNASADSADDDFDGGIEIDLDGDADPAAADASDDLDLELGDDDAETPAPESTDAGGASQSATTSQQIASDLEEAEFYFQQEMFDEAENIYRRVLTLAPSHPSALLRLGEIEAQQAANVSADAGASAEPATDTDFEVDIDLSTDGEASAAAPDPNDELDIEVAAGSDADDSIDIAIGDDDVADEIEIDADDQDDAGDEIASAADTAEDIGIDLAGEDVDDCTESVEVDELEDPVAAESAAGALSSPTVEQTAPEAESGPGEVAATADEPQAVEFTEPAPRARSEETQPIEPSAPVAVFDTNADTGSATFDLAAELREAFEDEPEAEASGQGGVLSTVEDGFASIFSEFKKGVSETLSEDDTETRYDLGIAYREMGLYEDAIAEFRVCLGNPSRRLDSLTMMGLCALDLDRADDAVNHFEQALATEGIESPVRLGVTFDLGRAFEALGQVDRAREAYQTVAGMDADFQDVRQRLAALSDPAPDDGAGYESFDDLTSGIQDAEPAESFESFDDVITDAEVVAESPEADAPAEAESDEEPPPAAAPAAVEPEPEPAPAAPKSPTPGRPRRKKISFV